MDIHPDVVPLRIDEAGAIRVGQTRMLFVLVVEAYRSGATPEQIASEIYPSLKLADAYAVLAYYLRHKDEVEHYIACWNEEGERLRKKIEAAQGPPRVTREVLRARWEALEKQRAAAGR